MTIIGEDAVRQPRNVSARPPRSYVDRFAAFLAGEGYAGRRTNKCALIVRLSHWLKRHGVTRLARLDEERIRSFTPTCNVRGRGDVSTSDSCWSFLRSLGAVSRDGIYRRSVLGQLTRDYERFLISKRVWPLDGRWLCRHGGRFLTEHSRAAIASSGSAPPRLHRFVLGEARRVSRSMLERRSRPTLFLRFLRQRGDRRGLVPRLWSLLLAMAHIPKSSAEQVERLLPVVIANASGQRDYAIYCSGSTRVARRRSAGSDLGRPRLERGEMLVRGKGRAVNDYHCEGCGAALVRYLRYVRLLCDTRVFVRLHAPTRSA